METMTQFLGARPSQYSGKKGCKADTQAKCPTWGLRVFVGYAAGKVAKGGRFIFSERTIGAAHDEGEKVILLRLLR